MLRSSLMPSVTALENLVREFAGSIIDGDSSALNWTDMRALVSLRTKIASAWTRVQVRAQHRVLAAASIVSVRESWGKGGLDGLS